MADTSRDFLLDAIEAAHRVGTCDPRECFICAAIDALEAKCADAEEGGEA